MKNIHWLEIFETLFSTAANLWHPFIACSTVNIFHHMSHDW